MTHPRPNRSGLVAAFVVASLCAVSAQAQTLYKVIGPDGKVTYTDRPVAADTRVTPLARGSESTIDTSSALPLELRQTVGRYPVTLYVGGDDCDPCGAARQLLRQRGIPYVERQVLTPEDGLALERVSGGRDAPTLGIGAQILRGLSPELWNSYLDAAGYPRLSQLPANYQYAAATPLAPRAAAASASSATAPLNEAATLPNLPNASGIRF